MCFVTKVIFDSKVSYTDCLTGSYHMNSYFIPLGTDIHIMGVVYIYAKQKHLGCKKVRGQSEATLLKGMCDQKL